MKILIFILVTLYANATYAEPDASYHCMMKEHAVITSTGNLSRKKRTEFKFTWKNNEVAFGGGFPISRMKIKRVDSEESFHAQNLGSDEFLTRSILVFKNGKMWFTENYGHLAGVTTIYSSCEKSK